MDGTGKASALSRKGVEIISDDEDSDPFLATCDAKELDIPLSKLLRRVYGVLAFHGQSSMVMFIQICLSR